MKCPALRGSPAFQIVKQGFEPLPHGLQGTFIAQRADPLPPQAFAAQLCLYRLQQGTTALLRLLHHKRQYHHHRKDDREILLAMTVMML